MAWGRTVLVKHKLAVSAPPDEVWALGRGPAALSAWPGWFAFEVPAEVKGADRLCCVLGGDGVPFAAVFDVRWEVPGQEICWQSRSTASVGEQTLSVGVRPHRRGSVMRLSFGAVVPRPEATEHEAYLHRRVRAWGASLRAIAEGQAPWPGAGMPASMQQSHGAPRALKEEVQASAAVVVRASAETVWKKLQPPEAQYALFPGQVEHAGYVPGTPQSATGEMQYRVARQPDERFTVDVTVTTELVDGAREANQRFAPPHRQFSLSLTRVPDGTRMDLMSRHPALPKKAGGRDQAAQMAARLQRTIDAWKALVES